MRYGSWLLTGLSTCLCLPAGAQDTSDFPGDAMIAEYFREETERLSERCLSEIKTLDDWRQTRDESRRQLLEMLGLDPLPEKTPLQAEITGTREHDGIVVENLHFQSRPGLYVTANLYRPATANEPLPAILYVCGHGRVKKDGVSYGNKVHYHHHGAWFARNGYVCLTIDTLQLGEIEGIHHGTYREKMWWWFNRGYTPAGVEAWNCVRALDYLETRPEVDASRFGVTGRSGGGAYSWWIAAIDDRIRAAVPVAGITDLQNHVVDGCVEGHCDCMFMVNTYRWDYAQVAALVAPRPLLISNTDRDRIFPLDGVYRTHKLVRRIYELHDADDKLALHITAGPHSDTQELRIHAFRWFNQHLRDDDSLIDDPADRVFEPKHLRVFQELPGDQRNTTIQETFVPLAETPVPRDQAQWRRLRERWTEALRTRVFRGWPEESDPPSVRVGATRSVGELRVQSFEFESQSAIGLTLFVVEPPGRSTAVRIVVLDEASWNRVRALLVDSDNSDAALAAARQHLGFEGDTATEAVVCIAPRGIGPTAWTLDERTQTHRRRRFYMLGQTLDGMRVFDIHRTLQAVRQIEGFAGSRLTLQSSASNGGDVLYAALFHPDLAAVHLPSLPPSHADGPFLLNVRRFFDLPQVAAMVCEHVPVHLWHGDAEDWTWTAETAAVLGWRHRLKLGR